MFEIADPIPNMGSMGHFQVSSTYSPESLETNEIWVQLRTGQDLETGQVKENRSLSFRGIEVRNSRPHTQIWAVWAIFKLAVRIVREF